MRANPSYGGDPPCWAHLFEEGDELDTGSTFVPTHSPGTDIHAPAGEGADAGRLASGLDNALTAEPLACGWHSEPVNDRLDTAGTEELPTMERQITQHESAQPEEARETGEELAPAPGGSMELPRDGQPASLGTDEQVEEASEESFPASDPPSYSGRAERGEG